MNKKAARLAVAISAASAGLLAVAAPGASAGGTIVYSFTGGSDGGTPHAPVIFGPGGDLYGTTQWGGAHGDGAVFQLVPHGTGWSEHVIYSFSGGADGWVPDAGLTYSGGSLYGTVAYGGSGGHGAVFELSQNSADGSWSKQSLYSFTGGTDGSQPVAGVTSGPDGKLYGTTGDGGADGQGVVYALTPGSGSWSESVLHSFTWPAGGDGASPDSTPVFDKAGNLYGVTVAGGTYNAGIVYRLSAASGWSETILHTFTGSADGGNPVCDLVFDQAGVLYGTTTSGGTARHGTVFGVTGPARGTGVFHTVYAFRGGATGGNPYAGVTVGAHGELYGTTASGVYRGGGVVYRLSRGLFRRETVLYTFDNPGNGSWASLTRDAAGNLFGTTVEGGSAFSGSVFEVSA